MAKAAVSIVTLVMVAIIMVSIITSIPSSLGNGAQIQPVYSPGATYSPTDYASAILSKR
jgi:hypothetical protein